MNLRCIHIRLSAARRMAAFTMLEIAIALAVIAFALVAIIGILPAGLQVNRDTREETVINQDARLLMQAIRNGGRDRFSDIGAFVRNVDGATDYGPSPLTFLQTSNLVKLLTDTNTHEIVFESISGAIAMRQSDLAFRYQVRNEVRRAREFDDSPLSNQVYEVRLRFAWPVLPNYEVASEANRFVTRMLVSGVYTNGFLYAQEYPNLFLTNVSESAFAP